jgi:hypothetical protein
MQGTVKMTWLAVAGVIGVAGCAGIPPGPKEMTFFVTSVGPGKGGDLGGLEGADRHCQSLARAAGAGDRPWRAYLSTQAPKLADPDFVNARDRIGSGPWQNAKGEVIAWSVEDLHSASSNLNRQTALDEKGQLVNSRTEKPNKHDILTALPLETIKLPPGFAIELWARVDNARQMALGGVDAKGGVLYVGSRGAGKVHAVRFDAPIGPVP